MTAKTPGIPIEAWAQETLDNLSTLHISAATAARPLSRPPDPHARPTPSVTLDIPLDGAQPAQSTRRRAAEANGDASDGEGVRAAGRRREPIRRDSLKRREALLKGKEGSRRRQRWENDRLLGNPHVVAPEPHDWAPQPTHPVHAPVPYFLAPLWDERKAQAERARRQQHRRRSDAAGVDSADAHTGAAHRVPRDLRDKLKRSRAARGLLHALEEQVRQFVWAWAEAKGGGAARWQTARVDGDADADEDEWSDAGAALDSSSSSSSSSDDEIVFVGRGGTTTTTTTAAAAAAASPSKSRRRRRRRRSTAERQPQRDKLLFDAPVDDHGARVGRWLVHELAGYYNLRSWSVTTAGDPARREAYVGIPEGGRDALPLLLVGGCGRGGGVEGEGEGPASRHRLPTPLWGMV